MVQRYHIYILWDASVSEELSCQREAENYTDPFAVTVMKDDNIVGSAMYPGKFQQCACYFSIKEVCCLTGKTVQKMCCNTCAHLFQKLS